MSTPAWMIGAGAGLAPAACMVHDDGNTQAPEPEATGVVREDVAAPTPTSTAAIRTQPGPRGDSVALNRVSVAGDILTVTTTSSGGSCCVHMPVDEVNVIDDATSQRISVLKDNGGRYMAPPLETSGQSVGPDAFDKPSVVWFKFPAPPATSRTVSIALRGVEPSDAVRVAR